jgi:hypothetical protein
MVIKFFAIVGLDAHNGSLELRMNESMKSNQGGQHVGLLAKGKCPQKVRKIIQNHKVKLETRIANDGRSPHITMK